VETLTTELPSGVCIFLVLVSRKRRRGEPRARVVVLVVLRVLKVLRDNKAKKINAKEGERPPFMG